MLVKFKFLAVLGAILWLQPVAAQFDVFKYLTSPLTPNDPTVNYISPSVMGANLNTLATLMGQQAQYFASRLRPGFAYGIGSGGITTFPSNFRDAETWYRMGIMVFLSILSPMANELVTITNNTRYGRVTPAPAVSLLQGLPAAFGIPSGVTLDPVTYAPGTNAISPDIFLARFKTLGNLIITIYSKLFSYAPRYVAWSKNVILGHTYMAIGWTAGPLNSLVSQILTQVKDLLPPADPSATFTKLTQLVTGIQLVGNYIPGNTSLIPSDPIQTYTCGAVFLDNLNLFYKLLRQNSIAASNLINSNSTVPASLVPVQKVFQTFNRLLPYLVDLGQQISELIQSVGTFRTNTRRTYPVQVRTDMYKADCHLLYLKKFNARRMLG